MFHRLWAWVANLFHNYPSEFEMKAIFEFIWNQLRIIISKLVKKEANLQQVLEFCENLLEVLFAGTYDESRICVWLNNAFKMKVNTEDEFKVEFGDLLQKRVDDILFHLKAYTRGNTVND